jgi:light-regulated signal transduction histidine kinase (bacteriophytochrome)
MLCATGMRYTSGPVVTAADLHSLMAIEASSAESEQLRRQIDQEEMYQFAKGAVHDLRSAQRGAVTSAQMLQDLLGDSLSPEARSILARLVDCAERTDAILAAAGSYAAALPAAGYSFHKVKVSSVVRDALKSLEPEICKSGASVTYGELPEVWGDRDRLQELFRRLIDNALKYSNQAPRVEIGAREAPGLPEAEERTFSVRDHGIGIEPKYQRELFRPFRRLHGPEIPGLGLGLVVCRRITETHGGKLWIESAAGNGTTVFVTLPVPA